MKIYAYLVLIFSCVVLAPFSFANEEQRSSQHLLDSCRALVTQSNNLESNACKYYIRGIVEGQGYTVESRPNSHAKNRRSSFFERAYRTRVGKRGERSIRSNNSRFCRDQNAQNNMMSRVISKLSLSDISTIEELKTKIDKLLKAEYPC